MKFLETYLKLQETNDNYMDKKINSDYKTIFNKKSIN